MDSLGLIKTDQFKNKQPWILPVLTLLLIVNTQNGAGSLEDTTGWMSGPS